MWPIVEKLQELSGKTYEEYTESMRVIADHFTRGDVPGGRRLRAEQQRAGLRHAPTAASGDSL